MLPQMFTFLCKKRTGRIIQKIGRLVFGGEGNGGQFFRRFCLFLARISSWFIPMFLSILSSHSFSFFSLSFLLVYVSHYYLSCFRLGPQAMYFKESFSFHLSSSLSLSLSHRYLCFSPQKCAQMIDTLLS